jgi:hypothetical protein
MTQYKVEVEFIAQVEQLKAQLAQAMSSIKGTDAAATTTSSALDRMGGAGAAAGQGIKKGAEDAKGALTGLAQGTTTATGEMGSALTGLIGKVGLVAAAWKAARAVFGFAEMGIEYSSLMETAQLGIASLIAAQAKLVDAKGQELKGQEALNAALVLSSDQMQKLKIAGLETVATTQQLVVAYQQAVGVGLSVGMNLDEIRQVTIKITQAAAALGLPMNQLAEEVRDLLQGNINPRNTRIATALQITNEEVRKWQAAGGHTLADELNKRMEAFGLAGDLAAKTWSGVTSNALEAVQTMAGGMTQPLFERIKTGLQKALEDAFNLKEARISDTFDGLVEAGKVASEALGDLFQEAVAGLVQSAKDLSTWFKENRKDVIEMVGAAKALAEQLGGVLKDVVNIAGAANQAQGQFSILKTLVEGIGLIVAVIRDVVSVVAFGLQTVGVFLLQGVLGPIQLVLIGIGDAMNYVKKGSGEAVIKVAEDMQKFLDTGHAGADAFLKPLLEGKGAVAQFGDSLLDAKMKAEALGNATKKAAESTTKVLPRPKPSEAADLTGVISAAEHQARMAAMRADAEERATLEQQKQHALSEANKQYLNERARLMKEAGEGKFNGNQGMLNEEWAANQARLKAKQASIEQQYADKRAQMEADLQAKLTAGEEGGLQQRLEAVRKTIEKMRHEAKVLWTSETTDAQKAAQDTEIVRAEQALKERARQDQIRADLGKLKQELAELAQIKGYALSFYEQEEVLVRFASRSKEAAEAVGKLRAELHMEESGTQGWFAGIRSWLGQAGNAFLTFKQLATSVMSGVEQSFARGISGLISHQMTLGQAMKAVWQGLVQTVAQAVGQMIARWAAMAIAKKLLGIQENAADGSRTAASLVTATAETWAAYAGIPVMGPIYAAAQIAAMYASMAASTGLAMAAGTTVTAMSVGGLVEKPQFTWLAEKGEPEVVAPQRSFMDWARHLFGMGANLQANVGRNDRIAMDYALQAGDYSRAAAEAGRGSSTSAVSQAGPIHLHAHLDGPIYDTSQRGMRELGGMVIDAARAKAREVGVVLVPGEVFRGV